VRNAKDLASYGVETLGRIDMERKEGIGSQRVTSKLIFYGMVATGLVAAYLMHKRGDSLVMIARRVVTNPVGSLVEEVENKV
jgi:hypothetical protein